ncbi:MAG: AraC family transcriptional regulator [Rhodoferax sp.]|nr:AraC family transcriptional regulator [Rhodoferax sp.]
MVPLRSEIRRYTGEHARHVHDYVQIMFALQGRMELEIGAHGAFADMSCGMVIPAGIEHGFMTTPQTQMFVIERPHLAGFSRVRRFAVTSACRDSARQGDVTWLLEQVLQAPNILARRGIDLTQLDAALAACLHETWNTARMASLFFLSPQRFHARLLELTGTTPQDYLRNRRFDAAERCLRCGMSLEAAALHVGYRSASALSFALKRDRQLSTRQLRAH